jgi:hypothetical protein
LRPPDEKNITDLPGGDEITGRGIMEASENRGLPRHGGARPELHRIDPDRVAERLSSGGNAAGFVRLNLMVNTIFDRLVAADERENRGRS